MRRARRRRAASGFNVFCSLVLAGVLFGMVNYLASREFTRWDISTLGYYQLSPKTLGLLDGLEATVEVVVFMRSSHALYDDVRNVLKEYQYAAGASGKLTFSVDYVDPDRDPARTRELAREYDVRTADVVVFECGGRRKYVEAKDLADYSLRMERGGAVKQLVGFKAEQAFSSAILNVSQLTRPVIYFLSGHGERDIEDYGKHSGYSGLARMMRRDNMDVRSLNLASKRAVPDDCAVLVVAGPDRRIAGAEVDIIKDYLEHNGRLCVLLDPVTHTGLEGLLAGWGVRLARDVVMGLTLTGRELVVTTYGDHPITRNLQKITTMFYMPRSIEALQGEDHAADRPRVTVLASTTGDGWAESDLAQSPAKFEPETDRPGPVSIAVAVEKGSVDGLEVELKPTRMVVIGDSSFVANAAVEEGVGGNSDFFLSAVNWLAERENLMAVAPKRPSQLQLDMNRRQLRTVFLLMVLGVPGFIAMLGVVVWFWRRQ